MNCRHCKTPLKHVFLDLGFAPPSNAYVTKDHLGEPENYYPLKVRTCDQCWLVQTEDYAATEELFNNGYAYFSSVSTTWLEHASTYVRKVTDRLNLNADSFVIEVASNDGYLLKNFVDAGIPCLGIEPTASTAAAAEKIGVPVLREFFCESLARSLVSKNAQADLIIGNNVYAHVPDINNFTKGLKIALKPTGTITLEFPHLLNLIKFTQFDTVYHEHFSYLSLSTVCRIFEAAGLKVFDVEEHRTHGGSLRVFGCHSNDPRPIFDSVQDLIEKEQSEGLEYLGTYLEFQSRADKVKNDFLLFLLNQKLSGKKVAAYGAAAKGNTLINYAGLKQDLLSYVCDSSISKQGHFLPGSHIPIYAPDYLAKDPPDYLVVLPWNLLDEVRQVCSRYCKSDMKFVVAVPNLTVL